MKASSVAAYCLDFTCSDTGEPITSVLMGLEGPPRWSFMTEPDFYDETVNSIKCYGNKEHECVKKRLGDVKFLFGDRTKSLMMSRCSMGPALVRQCRKKKIVAPWVSKACSLRLVSWRSVALVQSFQLRKWSS